LIFFLLIIPCGCAAEGHARQKSEENGFYLWGGILV
jgi:hypothetical protein